MKRIAWACPACGAKLGVDETDTQAGRIRRERRCLNPECDNRRGFATVEVSEQSLRRLSQLEQAIEAFRRTLDASPLRRFTLDVKNLLGGSSESSSARDVTPDN